MRASCGCGQLHVDFAVPPALQFVCHCADCRAVTGEPMTGAVFFPRAASTVHGEGRDTTMVAASGQPKRYVACTACGDMVFGEVNVLGGMCAVRPETLGEAFTFAPMCHVWTSEKADGVELSSDLPQFPRAPTRLPSRR
ncbi:MAG: hypothetical protein EP330_21570 [Deltaproteobacteria bacterium]|nr:MAG: hypothetical protein EP330_21570 [Deltaproteobacteria bacterium]